MILYYLHFCIPLVLICISMLVMSRVHAAEVYWIWYIFFLLLIIFTGLKASAQTTRVENQFPDISAVCGSLSNACSEIYGTLTNPIDEALLVSGVLTLIIGPQIMTYVVSGLFGCASTPRFVANATKIAMWSLIKFLVGLGAIVLSDPLAELIFDPKHFYGSSEFEPGLWFTCIGFLLGIVLVVAENKSSLLRRVLFDEKDRRILRGIVATRQWFRRNRKREMPKPHILEFHIRIPELDQELRAETRFKLY